MEPAEGSSGRPIRFLWVVLIYGALVSALTIPAIAGPGAEMSAFDEPTHLDYAWRVSRGELPARGDPLAAETRETWSCARQDRVPLPDCEDPGPPQRYPNQGLNYNFWHPPTFYAVTGVTARVVSAIVPGVGFFVAARFVSSLWVLAGLVGVHLCLRRLGVRPLVAFAAPLLLITVPTVFHAATTVNNDAPALLVGAAALFVLIVAEQRREPFPYAWCALVALGSALLASTKVVSGVALIAVAVVLGGRAVWRRSGARDLSHAVLAVCLTVPVAVVHLLWRVFQGGRGLPAAQYESPVTGENTRVVEGLPFDEWVPAVARGFDLTRTYYLQPLLRNPYLDSWIIVLGFVLTAAALLAIVAGSRVSRCGPVIGVTVLVGSVLYPLTTELNTFLGSTPRRYFPIVSSRYGLSLLAFAVAALAVSAHTRGLRRGVLGLSGAGLVVIAATVFAAPL